MFYQGVSVKVPHVVLGDEYTFFLPTPFFLCEVFPESPRRTSGPVVPFFPPSRPFL